MGAPFSCKFQPNGKNVSGYQHVPDQPEIILTEVKKICIPSNKTSRPNILYILHTLNGYREKKTNPY